MFESDILTNHLTQKQNPKSNYQSCSVCLLTAFPFTETSKQLCDPISQTTDRLDVEFNHSPP